MNFSNSILMVVNYFNIQDIFGQIWECIKVKKWIHIDIVYEEIFVPSYKFPKNINNKFSKICLLLK